MSTRFAVVITCYNYKDFVIEAVESALKQSRTAEQVVVVDDGSTDGSTELLREKYGKDPRITLLCVTNGGQLSAFQKAVALVTDMDVVAFLDADDRWDDDYLAKIGELYDRRHDIDFIFSNIRMFGSESSTKGYADRPLDLGYTVVSTYALAHWHGAPTSALSMRTSWACRALNLPPEMLETWRICADMCLVHGASIMAARKYYLPTNSVHYRTHGNNGWFGRRGEADKFMNRFRARCLVRYYAQRIGVTEWCLEDTKYEYKTKPEPSWAETKRYARISMQRKGSWWRNLERALAILRRGWRVRHSAPTEFRNPP